MKDEIRDEEVGGERQRRPAGGVRRFLRALIGRAEEPISTESLAEPQRRMIEGILDFRDADAREVMTPRTDMVGVEAIASLAEVIEMANESGHSRLPVWEESRDNICGIVYVKDCLKWWNTPADGTTARDLMREAYFVPETKGILALLREFQSQKIHVAMVVDEYGGTAGIVTLEDILENIVGEIQDEYDQEESEPLIRNDDGSVDVSGAFGVKEANEEIPLLALSEDDDYETIAGYILAEIGRLPRSGERVERDGFAFTILESDRRKISRIRIEQCERGTDARKKE